MVRFCISMDPEILYDRRIDLQTASDIARFCFIVQDSISYLDLNVSEDGRLPDYFRAMCDSCKSRRLRNFVNTEEKCRQLFAPRRRLLYTLNLDLPKGRECSLKVGANSIYSWYCCKSPHIAEINVLYEFYDDILSNFIKDALNINVPKEKILRWIAELPFSEMDLLFHLGSSTTSKFIDCFYPEVTDSELFRNFLKQFDFVEWMADEQPEIIEHLLYHAHLFEDINLDDKLDIEAISHCIHNKCYLNIRPILKYISDSRPTYEVYENYFFELSSDRPSLAENVAEALLKSSITRKRSCHLMQVILVYTDSRLHDLQNAASEALRLIWSSVPDACLTFGELEEVFSASLSEDELKNIHDFYVEAVGEFHECVEPRSLQHLCRTALRRTFQKNNLWIPDAVGRTGLPKSLQSFLNLEKQFIPIKVVVW